MPDWREIVRERLAGCELDGAREAEIVDEMAQHLEDRYVELRSRGFRKLKHGVWRSKSSRATGSLKICALHGALRFKHGFSALQRHKQAISPVSDTI